MTGRVGALIAYGLLAGPAFAGALPIDGAFGNDAGCNLFASGQVAGDYQLLTADTFSSPAMGCAFGAPEATQSEAIAATAVCSPGGKTSVAITDHGVEGYTIAVGTRSWGPLKACPPVDLGDDSADVRL